MILKLRIKNIRFTLTLAEVIDVLGVNSKLQDGKHILMWDFDSQPLEQVMRSLRKVQQFFDLPQIHILLSSPPRNFIAYCFKRCEWKRARSIVGFTEGIDENFFKWAVFRRRFTLRVGAKNNRTPMGICCLHSKVPEDVKIQELKSWVKYETLDSHHTAKVMIVEVP